MLQKFVLTFLLVCFATPASAANISNEFVGRSLRTILIEGEIERGDYEKFVDAVLEAGSYNHFYVFIASAGGDADVAMKIGKLIRSLKFTTYVPQYLPGYGADCRPYAITKSNCLCTSACVLVYLAGVKRIGDFLGVHRTFLNHEFLRSLPMNKVQDYQRRISTTTAEYMNEMGAPNSLIEKIESVSSDEIVLLDYDFVDRHLSGFTKDYQEWVIAKCGATSELHVKRRLGDEEAFNKIERILRCQRDLMRNERDEVFYPTISSAFENAEDSLVPRRSLLESLKNKLPFDLTQLIGMDALDAMDLLSLIGLPPNLNTKEEIEKKFNNASYSFDESIRIGFDTGGKVYSVNIGFYSTDGMRIFRRHFSNGLNSKSSPDDFVRQYGKPSQQSCYPTGVCFLIISSDKVDLQILFNVDESLRAIQINEADYWEELLEPESS